MEQNERLAKLKRYKELLTKWKILGYKPYPRQEIFHHLPQRERALFGANQSGKTFSAGMEVAMHLTGIYPEWWKGVRFNKAVRFGIGSETGDLLKKGPQRILTGSMEAIGTGTIPSDLLVWPPKMARNIPDGIDSLQVRHTTNGVLDGTLSAAVFMSYADGRAKWASDVWDGAWFDEEPELEIYTEGLTRTNTSMGPVIITFTPMRGMSDIALRFLQEHPNTAYVKLPITETLHYRNLTPEQQQAWLQQYPEHERRARLEGEPMLGEGRIFKQDEALVRCEPFEIPKHFAVLGAMDFGIDHPFAAVKIAHDRDSDIVYLTHSYRERGLTPIGHAAALRLWGSIPWAWPHDGLQRDKKSGVQLAQFYREQGLGLLSTHAQYPDERGNGLEASITDISQRIDSGRFKVFSHLENWFEEYRFYHRKIVLAQDGSRRAVPLPERDDLISATRYALMCLHYAEVPQPLVQSERYRTNFRRRRSWMAA